MSQYSNNPLQNTCDLSQTSNNLSLSLDKLDSIGLLSPLAALSTENISNPLNQINTVIPSDSDGLPTPKTRHVNDDSETKSTSKDTLILDGKTYVKKCEIYDETPCYSPFVPNEKTVLLPLVVRSLTTAKEWEFTYMPIEQQNRYLEFYGHFCKQRDLISFERKQRAQFYRTSGRTAKALERHHDFFDKKVKPLVPRTPIPSPSPSHSSVREREVDLKKSNSQSQANTLTNEPYSEKKHKIPKVKAIVESDNLKKAKKIPKPVVDLIEKTKLLHDRVTKTYDHHKNPDELNLTIELSSYISRFKIQTDEMLHFEKTKKRDSVTGAKRGVVIEFSKRARHRLFEKSLEWELLGYDPEFMLTLTMPGEFKSLNLSGSELNYKLDKFRKRVEYWLDTNGIDRCRKVVDKKTGKHSQIGSSRLIKAFYIKEFQQRGALHVHIIFCDTGMDDKMQKIFHDMCLKAWAELIGHPDPVEYKKHLKTGVHYDKLVNKDLRYLRAYMSKKNQKVVPEGYEGVGNFWGTWWEPRLSPITFTVRVSDQIVSAISEMALIKYRELSQKVARRVHRGLSDRFAPDSLAKSFAHKLYGDDVVNWFLDVIPFFEIQDGEKIPDDALARADEMTKKYWWDDDWESWLQAHRGVLIGQLYN